MRPVHQGGEEALSLASTAGTAKAAHDNVFGEVVVSQSHYHILNSLYALICHLASAIIPNSG
jgi:hypothetical protein